MEFATQLEYDIYYELLICVKWRITLGNTLYLHTI